MALRRILASLEPPAAHWYGPVGWMGCRWCSGASGCGGNGNGMVMETVVGAAAAV